MIVYILLAVCLILCLFSYSSYKKGKIERQQAEAADEKHLEELRQQHWDEILKDTEKAQQSLDEFNQKTAKAQQALEEFNQKAVEAQSKLNQLANQTALYEQRRNSEMQRAAEARAATNKLLEAEHERVAAELRGVKQLEEEKMNREFETKKAQLNLLYQKESNDLQELYETDKEEKEAELAYIKKELAEFQAKRAAINEQLRREEELANEQDFHRIILSNNDKEDIHYLLSIEQNIHNKELLHKLIWTEYIQRPFNTTLKNILGNKSPKNVIYCIENINNHKKYIGKTRGEYKDRQVNHLKASLSIGTISHQYIHDALFGHWDEFMFYILEEVQDANKLNEREKYYINFYETDKYGYNAKQGG